MPRTSVDDGSAVACHDAVQRLDRAALSRRYESLDPPSDGAFDRIAGMAARICGTPIATVSIVDEDRVWFAAAKGLDGVTEVGTEPGLCASAVLGTGPYVVSDAKNDPRTMDHPLVRGDQGFRFYAAAPIVTADGHVLGAVSVIDRKRRKVSAVQLGLLADLADTVAELLQIKLTALDALRAEQVSRAEESHRRDAADQLNQRMTEAADAVVGRTRPDWCQLGGTRQCEQSAELKVADSWGDSAWGCLEHAEDALRQVPSVYLAQDTPNGLKAYRMRQTRPAAD